MSETGKATPAEILRTIGHMLSAITHFPGRLLYSGMDTIRPGDLYVLGMNPGGRFTLNPPLNQTIGFTLAEARQRWSFLDDEPDPPAAGLLQARVKGVLEDLNCNPRETLVTNAVFVRAGNVEQFGKLGLSFWQLWWNLCWPVHQVLLGAVRPKLVLCFATRRSARPARRKAADINGRRSTAMLRIHPAPIGGSWTSDRTGCSKRPSLCCPIPARGTPRNGGLTAG